MKIFKKIGLVLSALVLTLSIFTVFTVAQQGRAHADPTCNAGYQTCSSGTTTPPTSCEAGSGGWALTWLLCPVFDAATGIADAMISAFENQLSFRVSDLNTKSDNQGQQSVQTAWSLIRDLASAALVIVMLVMVIAQAVGGGPFDAYTVRKMLPRLVAAIILMQISWPLLSWVVNVFDDLGKGIQQIMYAPFQAPVNGVQYNLSKFQDLLGHAGIGAGPGIAVNWLVLIPALTTATILGLPTILMFIFMALVAIGVGLAVLVFRKILIIMLLIFAPIAILAWILPGTESYFKKWQDALIKALMMFPIAVAIIAAGRIFAYVAGSTGGGTFMNFFLVLVGFFGPMFILPKTFKWGGEAMQAVGNGAFKLAEKSMIGKDAKPMKYFKGQQEKWSNERLRQSQERYNQEKGFDRKHFWRRPLDLAHAGQLDPLSRIGAGHERRLEEASTHYKVAGAESEKKEIEAANTAAQLTIERLNPNEKDAYARALAAGQKLKITEDGKIMAQRYKAGEIIRTYDEDGNVIKEEEAKGGELKIDQDGTIIGAEGASYASLTEIRAGLDQVNRLGGEKNIEYVQKAFERAMNGDYMKEDGKPFDKAEQVEMMNKFTTAQVGTLFGKLPHLYKNNDYAVRDSPDRQDVVRTVEGINPEDITKLSGVGMETLIKNLEGRAGNEQLSEAERGKSVAALRKLATTYQEASNDPTLRGRIPEAVKDKMSDLAGRADRVEAELGGGLGSTIRTATSSPPQGGPALAQSAVQQPSAQSSGTLTVPHGEPIWRQRVPESKLDTPDASGWTPREDAHAENAARDEYNYLRNLSVRTPEQETRFQQYRTHYPDW